MISSTRYFQNSSSPPLGDQAACDLFARVHSRGQWLQVWSLLKRKPRGLLPLKCIDEGSIENIQVKAGIQIVPISQIRGSENRFDDFDCDFYPLKNCTRDRWLRIASARMQGKYLPPVVLVQVGDLYFVRDGHHRISVARALRETVVQAKVIVWHLADISRQKASCPSCQPILSPLAKAQGNRLSA